MKDLIDQMNGKLKIVDDEKRKQDEELKKTKELLENTTKLEELLSKKNTGVSVVYKGAYRLNAS